MARSRSAVQRPPPLTTFLREYFPGPIRVEALSHFPIERDLVVDAEDFMHKLTRIQPWIVPREELSTEDRKVERWVVVEVQEAYIHCRKHIPRMIPVDRIRDWGTDDVKRKGGDFFGAKADKSAP